MSGEALPPAVLPDGHRCRVDDVAYPNAGAWYRAHAGRVPVQAAAALDRYMRERGCPFAEAFSALTGPRGPIILLDVPPRAPRAPRRRPARVDEP